MWSFGLHTGHTEGTLYHRYNIVPRCSMHYAISRSDIATYLIEYSIQYRNVEDGCCNFHQEVSEMLGDLIGTKGSYTKEEGMQLIETAKFELLLKIA